MMVLRMDRKSAEISIVCCVSRPDVFQDCLVRSLEQDGTIARMEIIPVDNTGNRYSAPEALNLGLDQASARIVVCCHQDVRMPEGWLDRFLRQIELIEKTDSRWGGVGVMGIRHNGAFAGHVKDPHTDRPFGRLPEKVLALDEVCLAVRRDGGLRFDEGLGGFHFYGADLCLQARLGGMQCYAVDAPLEHLSGGRCDESFYQAADRLRRKWRSVPHAPLVIETTCGVFPLRDGVRAFLLTRLVKLRRKFWWRLQRRGR